MLQLDWLDSNSTRMLRTCNQLRRIEEPQNRQLIDTAHVQSAQGMLEIDHR